VVTGLFLSRRCPALSAVMSLATYSLTVRIEPAWLTPLGREFESHCFVGTLAAWRGVMNDDAADLDKHPDSPGDESVEEALNGPTRESMESLGGEDHPGDRPGSSPRPSQAEGGDDGSVDRPPRPSQAEGERRPE
jgi:hypothetical protein